MSITVDRLDELSKNACLCHLLSCSDLLSVNSTLQLHLFNLESQTIKTGLALFDNFCSSKEQSIRVLVTLYRINISQFLLFYSQLVSWLDSK